MRRCPVEVDGLACEELLEAARHLDGVARFLGEVFVPED
jgi:hypothetical protein